jgi:hypothetical protein
MNQRTKRIGIGVALLGLSTLASAALAVNFPNHCSGGFIVSVNDTQSCSQSTLTYANTATPTRVRANLVKISPAVGRGIRNQASSGVFPLACSVDVIEGGSKEKACPNGVPFHQFFILN